VHAVHQVSDLTEALQDQPCDLVVVAGGDGTVGRAACELSGWNVPLSIFPFGTANNTALSLDLSTDPERAARGWQGDRSMPFDLGLVGDGFVRRRFAEAVGWGVFPAAIAKTEKMSAGKSAAGTLERDRKLFRLVVSSAPPRDYRIELDGRDISGAYLLVEIMNLPLLGPRLPLSPSSDPADGIFELVLAAEEHRAALEELASDGTPTLSLALRDERGTHLRIETSEVLMHYDGRLWRHPAGRQEYEIDVDPGAVQYLVDAGAGQNPFARSPRGERTPKALMTSSQSAGSQFRQLTPLCFSSQRSSASSALSAVKSTFDHRRSVPE
jgi:diacylglycerol kinase family enzyme